jgi:hypothetical protein
VWSWNLAKELTALSPSKYDLWAAVVRGWSTSDLDDGAWKDTLSLLIDRTELHTAIPFDIAHLIEEGIKKAVHPIPSDCFELAMRLSEDLWGALKNREDRPASGSKSSDWVMRAINHPAGTLTWFWLNLLTRKRKDQGSEWKGIPAELKTKFVEALVGSSYSAELSRVLLASQLNLLFGADESWAIHNILPLFDWTQDGLRAEQAFHGFLTWGHHTEALLPHILPMYEKAFSHIAELGDVRDRFTGYLAGLAITSSVNPLKHGWLRKFMMEAGERDRRNWASQIRIFLRGLPVTASEASWDNWIKEFWRLRLAGLLVAFEPIELGEMVEWTLYFGSRFPEATEKIAKSSSFELRNTFIFTELSQTSLPELYPTASGQLLLSVLKNTPEGPHDPEHAETVVRRITPLAAPIATLHDICAHLSRLGYAQALALKTWIDEQRRM